MIPSNNFYKLLERFENCKLYAYKDSAGIPTIGIGTIVYPDGTKVKMGDRCTVEQANQWARYEAGKKSIGLANALVGVPVSQNQFEALLSLVYNIGLTGFTQSTLLKRIKAGKPDDEIRAAFMMWNKARNPETGILEPVKGLTDRRKMEADIYLS